MIKRFTLEETKKYNDLSWEIVKVEDFLSDNNAADLASRITVNLHLVAPVSVKTICDTVIKDHEKYLKQLKEERDKFGKSYKF